MKTPYLKSNHHILRTSLVLLTVSIALIIHSCRKDVAKKDQSPAEAALTDRHIDIARLKTAYNNGTNSSGLLKLNDVNQQAVEKIIGSLNVDWTSYNLYTYPDSVQVIEFAMPDDSSLLVPNKLAVHDSLKYRSRTTAVFILCKDTINISFFMKTIEDRTASGYQPVLGLLHYQQVPYPFSGDILYFTLNRQFINGYKWLNGSIIKTLSLSTSPAPQTKQANNKNKLRTYYMAVDCETVTYELYAYTYGNGELTNTEDLGSFTIETCTYYDDGGGGGSGGGVGGGGSSVPPTDPCVPKPPAVESVNGKLKVDYVTPPTGGGGGTTPCPPAKETVLSGVSDITNNVTNPCLSGLINQLKNDNTIQSDVTNILRNTFGVSDQVNITFAQATFTGANSSTDAETSGGQKDNLDVTFNTSVITKASKEYLMETSMHEIYHAYLDVNPSVSKGFSQHAYMIQNYVNTEVTSLRKVFPKLSLHDAQCLVLGGYGDLDPTTVNATIASYGLTTNDVVTTNNKFKTGVAGTKC